MHLPPYSISFPLLHPFAFSFVSSVNFLHLLFLLASLDRAKEVLDGMNAKYTVVELDTDPDGKAIRAEMAGMVGRTSVPAIWIQGQFVGGCNDGPMGGIVKLSESGELTGLLKAAGAL